MNGCREGENNEIRRFVTRAKRRLHFQHYLT